MKQLILMSREDSFEDDLVSMKSEFKHDKKNYSDYFKQKLTTISFL